MWEYVLTNTGNAPISNPRVEDDAGTPGDPIDDFFAAFVSGDSDNDGILDAGETWIFEASGTATESAYTNNAVATGIGPATIDEDGTPVPGVPLEDDDPSGYVVASPGIDIIKTTNGVDNTAAPGVYIAPGDPVTWTYIVTNTGDVPLSDVAVTDDAGTPAAGDDFTATLISGDTNDDGLLDLDETWIFEATGTAIAGQYQNNATVTGTPPEVTNPDGTTTTPDPITAEDDDRYFGAEPAVEITKSVNGDDANEAPGVLIPEGEQVSWTYEVVNTGTTPLIDVIVSDDQGVVVTCPQTTLGVSETMTCTGAAESATLGQYTNIGSVVAVSYTHLTLPTNDSV